MSCRDARVLREVGVMCTDFSVWRAAGFLRSVGVMREVCVCREACVWRAVGEGCETCTRCAV